MVKPTAKLSGRISPIQQNTRPETVISRSHAPSTDHRVSRVVRERVIADVVSPPVMEDYIPGEGVKLVELRGMGLENIRCRVNYLHGNIVMDSKKEVGTSVLIRVKYA